MQNQIQLSPALLQRLDALAAKLNVTAEYLWSVLLRQAKIEVVQDSINALLGLSAVCVSLCFAKRLWKWWQSEEYHEYDDEGKAIFGNLGCLVLLIIGVTAFLISLNQLYAPVFNPSYWALQQILGH
jgi:hypothetical protein